jgi:hypothetical protein
MKQPASKAKSPEELAANFERQLIETTRRSMAMRRHFPNYICRWRRAATTGPNAELALIFIWPKGQDYETVIWPYEEIERLAAEISDAEVFAELERRSRNAQEADAQAV